MYKVILEADPQTIKEARAWCKKNYGKIPLITVESLDRKSRQRIRFSSRYKFRLNHVYDDKNARWIHRLGKPYLFHFRDEKDMVEFGLKWL